MLIGFGGREFGKCVLIGKFGHLVCQSWQLRWSEKGVVYGADLLYGLRGLRSVRMYTSLDRGVFECHKEVSREKDSCRTSRQS